MSYLFVAVGSGMRDDETHGMMYPIVPSVDSEPLPDPTVNTIERANPDKRSGSGDVLITHEHGALVVTAVATSYPFYGRITSVGNYDNKGKPGYYSLARSFYMGRRWVYQGYSAASNHNSAARTWWCAVIDTSPLPKILGQYYSKPKIYEASSGSNYRISDDDHPYNEFPEDVLESQLASVLAKMPDTPAYNGVLYSSEIVSDVSISHNIHFVDAVDVTNYWRSRVWRLPTSTNLNSGFTEAYYQALSKLPQLEQNLFQNILELVSVVRSFADGFQPSDLTKLKEFKRTGQNAWLAYRYQYTTTVSDLMEITSTMNRLYALLSKRYIRSYGIGYNDGMTCHCCVVVDMGAYIDSLGSYLKRLNLRLTLYNVWDMIPYSFVVDWFLNIGDILHQLQEWIDAPSFPVTEIWYSFYTIQSDNSARTEIYGRWRGSAPSLPYIDVKSVSQKTLFMRIADTLSLFF